MRILRSNINYWGTAAILLTTLALSACDGQAGETVFLVQPARTAEPRGLVETPTATGSGQLSDPTPAPTGTPSGVDPRDLEPGFTTTETPFPEGFPILPGARFVAYNPAFDLCANGYVVCPVRQFPPQVWLFEMDISADPEATIRVIASQYTILLKAEGYSVETTLADDATILNFTGPGGSPARRGSIVIGPQVSGRTLPANARVIGLRIVIEHR